jgi:hypothetical protein
MRAVETLKGAVGQDGGTGRDSSFQADQRVPDCERERRDHNCLQRPQSLVFRRGTGKWTSASVMGCRDWVNVAQPSHEPTKI